MPSFVGACAQRVAVAIPMSATSKTIESGDIVLAVFLRRCALSALTTLSLAVPAMADGPPKQLYGKTVSSSCTMDQVYTGDDGREHRPQVRMDFVVYISTAGRIFTRQTISRNGRSWQGELSPGGGGGKVQASWSGRRLLLTRSYVSGAGQETIDFDGDYRTCSVSVLVGRQNGAPVERRSLMDGKVYRLVSNSVVSSSCSIAEGNSLSQ
jgi:hypothetical protein